MCIDVGGGGGMCVCTYGLGNVCVHICNAVWTLIGWCVCVCAWCGVCMGGGLGRLVNPRSGERRGEDTGSFDRGGRVPSVYTGQMPPLVL